MPRGEDLELAGFAGAGALPMSEATDTGPGPASLALSESFDGHDDATLVSLTLGGRRQAFDVIVGRHQRFVYQLCYRFVGNHEDASDVAQEVFLRAYRGLKNFKGESSLSTWLYRIGVNACLNRVAARRPASVPLDREIEAIDLQPDAATRLLHAERSRHVRAAVARLPPKQRSALILRVYHDLPHQQIARILGSSVGAVKANVFHALQNLKRMLATGDRK